MVDRTRAESRILWDWQRKVNTSFFKYINKWFSISFDFILIVSAFCEAAGDNNFSHGFTTFVLIYSRTQRKISVLNKLRYFERQSNNFSLGNCEQSYIRLIQHLSNQFLRSKCGLRKFMNGLQKALFWIRLRKLTSPSNIFLFIAPF